MFNENEGYDLPYPPPPEIPPIPPLDLSPPPPPPPGGLPFPTDWTVRDEFAACALTGYLAAYAGPGVTIPNEGEAAKAAYEYADAMLLRRSLPPTYKVRE